MAEIPGFGLFRKIAHDVRQNIGLETSEKTTRYDTQFRYTPKERDAAVNLTGRYDLDTKKRLFTRGREVELYEGEKHFNRVRVIQHSITSLIESCKFHRDNDNSSIWVDRIGGLVSKFGLGYIGAARLEFKRRFSDNDHQTEEESKQAEQQFSKGVEDFWPNNLEREAMQNNPNALFAIKTPITTKLDASAQINLDIPRERELLRFRQYEAGIQAAYAVVEEITRQPTSKLETETPFAKIATGEKIRIDSTVKVTHPNDPSRFIQVPIYDFNNVEGRDADFLQDRLVNEELLLDRTGLHQFFHCLDKSLDIANNDPGDQYHQLKIDMYELVTKYQSGEIRNDVYFSRLRKYLNTVEHDFLRISESRFYSTVAHQLRRWDKEDQTVTDQDKIHREISRHLFLQMSNQEFVAEAKKRAKSSDQPNDPAEYATHLADVIMEQAAGDSNQDFTRIKSEIIRYYMQTQNVAVELNINPDITREKHQLPTTLFHSNFVAAVDINRHETTRRDPTSKILSAHVNIAHAWTNGAPVVNNWINNIRAKAIQPEIQRVEPLKIGPEEQFSQKATNQFAEIRDLYGNPQAALNNIDSEQRADIINGIYRLDAPPTLFIEVGDIKESQDTVKNKCHKISELLFPEALNYLRREPATPTEVSEYKSLLKKLNLPNPKRSDQELTKEDIIKARVRFNLDFYVKNLPSGLGADDVTMQTIWFDEENNGPERATELMYQEFIRNTFYITPAILKQFEITGSLKDTDLISILIAQRAGKPNKLAPTIFGANGRGNASGKKGVLFRESSDTINFTRLAEMIHNFKIDLFHAQQNGYTILANLDSAIGRDKANFITKIVARLFPGSTSHASTTGNGATGSHSSLTKLSPSARKTRELIDGRTKQLGYTDISGLDTQFYTVSGVPYPINWGGLDEVITTKIQTDAIKEAIPADAYYEAAKTALKVSLQTHRKEVRSGTTSMLATATKNVVTKTSSDKSQSGLAIQSTIIEAQSSPDNKTLLSDEEIATMSETQDMADVEFYKEVVREIPLSEEDVVTFIAASQYAEYMKEYESDNGGIIPPRRRLYETALREAKINYDKMRELRAKDERFYSPKVLFEKFESQVFESDRNLFHFINFLEDYGKKQLIIDYFNLNDINQFKQFLHNPRVVSEVEKVIGRYFKGKFSEIRAKINAEVQQFIAPAAVNPALA